jgi:pyruvate,water dikinase
VAAVRAGGFTEPAPPIAEFRARVPAGDVAEFDERLADARFAYGIRDDNAGITLQWTVGLLRRALLEAGRRLTLADRLSRAEDTFDLRPEEIAGLLRGASTPGRGDVDARVEQRRANNALAAPATIGPAETRPAIAPLPAPLRRLGASFMLQADMLDRDASAPPLTGAGIGDKPVTGPARVVRSVEDAFDRLQAGDILVTAVTTPAYDAVLPLVAGLVVEEGGMLSHAAIVAREFGLPAVIGAQGAVDRIADGDVVEVDPVAGSVRVVN